MAVTIDGTNGITTPGEVNTANGSVAGDLTVTGFVRSSGVATNLYPLVSGTSVSASGTAVDFTGIPSWVDRITVIYSGISTNGTARVQLQVGPSGGVVTTGYTSYAGMSAGNTSITTGFTAEAGSSAAGWIRTGHFVLTLANSATNLWVASASMGILDGATGYGATGGGNITLAGALSTLRITTVGGTNTFDAGSFNILYE
jgi:hypothetical protein